MWEVKSSKEEFVKFQMAKNTTIIVSRSEAARCHVQNLKENNVAAEMSEDLMEYFTEMSHTSEPSSSKTKTKTEPTKAPASAARTSKRRRS